MTSPTSPSTPQAAERWERLAECFDQAHALPPGERAAVIARAFPDDDAARDEVVAMLHAADDLGLLGGSLPTDARDEDADDLPSGTRLGVWRVGTRIGRGGMGDVYRGERADGAFDQTVAVKVLRRGLLIGELTRRFDAERRILARLVHPGIVSITDGGTTPDGRPYLVMPLVEGLPLLEHCTQRRLDLDARLDLFRQIAAAVQYAHSRLVVHRDLKPSNILVTPAGEARLVDFGIAKLLDADDPRTGEATRSTLRLLTPEHAAPEQVRGEPVTTATDVYALGVLLYQMITGEKPHRLADRTLRELEHEILTLDPRAPSSAAAALPWRARLRGELDRIVLMALRKEPDRRYPSAAQLAEDVERWQRGLPVRAERDTMGYRVRSFVKRHRWGVGVSALAAVALITVAIVTTRQAARVAAERDRANRERAATAEVITLLTSLFEQANPMVVPGGDTLRVGQLLDAASRRIDALTAQPAVQARMWGALGRMHAARGELAPAQAMLRRSYDRLMALDGSDSLEVAETWRALTLATESYEGRARALPMFRIAAERWRRLEPAGGPGRTVSERELAERDEDLERQRTALAALATTTRLTTAEDSMSRAETLNALAVGRLRLGNVQEALLLFEEVLRLVEGLLPPWHPNRVLVAGNVAATRGQYGDFAGSEALATDVLAKQRARQPPAPTGVAAALEYLAQAEAARGFLDRAAARLDTAYQLRRVVLQPTHPEMVHVRRLRAVVALARQQPTTARAHLDSAVTLAERGDLPPTDRAALLAVRSEIALAEGAFDAAHRAIDAAQRLLTPDVAPTHRVRLRLAFDAALLALLERRPAVARETAARVVSGWTGRVPPQHPLLDEARCVIAVADQRDSATATKGADGALATACARYARYGLRLAPLVDAARSAGLLDP